VQILNLAERFESQANAVDSGKITSAQAAEKVAKESEGKYESMIVDAFVKAFGQKALAAGK
jgi:myo-inositol catabolism protein IolC